MKKLLIIAFVTIFVTLQSGLAVFAEGGTGGGSGGGASGGPLKEVYFSGFDRDGENIVARFLSNGEGNFNGAPMAISCEGKNLDKGKDYSVAPGEGSVVIDGDEIHGVNNSPEFNINKFGGKRVDITFFSTKPDGEIDYNGKKIYKTLVLPKAGEKRFPLIKEGENATYNSKTGGNLKFKSDAAFDTFKEVLVDGKIVPGDMYEKSEGSTNIVLYEAFLKGLSVGDHIIEIKSDYGKDGVGAARTVFTITNADVAAPADDKIDKPESAKTDSVKAKRTVSSAPATGDDTNLWLMIAGMVIPMIAIASLKLKRSR